jgi:hypothetical protein
MIQPGRPMSPALISARSRVRIQEWRARGPRLTRLRSEASEPAHSRHSRLEPSARLRVSFQAVAPHPPFPQPRPTARDRFLRSALSPLAELCPGRGRYRLEVGIPEKRRAMPRTDDQPVVKNQVDARQGVTGHNVRWVLGVGIAAAAMLFAALWLGWFG